MTAPMKPHPSMAVMLWLDKHGVDMEKSIREYAAYEDANVLGSRISRAVHLTENIAGSLARGTIGRRQAVEMLRDLHQALFELARDLNPDCVTPKEERIRWNYAANGMAPWQPSSVNSENAVRYGREPKNGETV